MMNSSDSFPEFLSVLCLSFLLVATHADRTFNVLQYGAVSDNGSDNSQSFLKAWSEACQWRGRSRVLIPEGSYYLTSVVFKGPCNGPTAFVVRGNLTAPIDPRFFFTDHWISFQNVNRLTIYGGGTLDGRGAVAWPYNRCSTGSCPPLPISLRLDFVNDSVVAGVRSVNSKNFHINVFSCNRLRIAGLSLSAPGDSPNTDGIHVADSGDVHVEGAKIATGDDCVSIGPGCRGVHVRNVTCGPGHGISVGSLGKSGSSAAETVVGVTVENCTFVGTLNGVHIKTWPDSAAAGGYAADFVYDGIVMKDVENPIFIDQQYCPFNLCNPQESSKIKIRNVTYKNIMGTSTTKDVVKLNCSRSNPCEDIVLDNINIVGPSGSASMLCSNAYGRSEGQLKPRSCLR